MNILMDFQNAQRSIKYIYKSVIEFCIKWESYFQFIQYYNDMKMMKKELVNRFSKKLVFLRIINWNDQNIHSI